MDLASLSLFSLLHLGSAIVSLALSSEVFLKNRKSPSHQQFFIWGLVSSAYLIALFFTLNASSADEAILLFRFSNQLYFVSIGLLAYLVHNLEPQRQQAWLILVAPMLAVSAALLIPYDARLTELGWSVDARPIITVEGIVVFVYLAGYSVLVATDLYHMMRKAGAPWLTRKYGIMLFSFVGLQIVGVVLLNALKLVVQGIPYVAGILYFFGLSALWYSFKMQQPKEVKLSGAQRGFTDSYARFMSRFLDVAPSDELGLKTVNLLEYLDKTRLRDYVTYDRLRIILNVDKMERLDNIQALDKTMEYLESKEWSSKLSDPFMDVLENVHQNMIETQETLEPFKEVLLSHQDFLKRTDIIYGFSRGQFLEFIGPDDSLGDRPEWEVALRMYKRWLLPIRMFLVGDIASEFYKMLRSTDVVKYLDISPEGEIGIDRVLSHIEALPQERRAEAVRVGFDALMSWVAQNLAAKDSASFIKWLKLVRKTTLLNSGARGVQKTFASLIARLSKDVERSRIRDLILFEGHKAEELDVFSSSFGLSHESLLHERALVEYDPRFSYEYYIGQLMSEISANTERCVVFTRSGGVIQRMALGLENVECRILATPGVEEENTVPFNDITRLIHAVGMALDSEMETWILFDNLSDLILPVGVEQAYVFARHATDLIGARNGSAVFLMNKSAHSGADRAAFEGLFSKIMEIGEKLVLVKR